MQRKDKEIVTRESLLNLIRGREGEGKGKRREREEGREKVGEREEYRNGRGREKGRMKG